MMSEHQRGGAKRQPDLTLSLWPTTCVQEGGGEICLKYPRWAADNVTLPSSLTVAVPSGARNTLVKLEDITVTRRRKASEIPGGQRGGAYWAGQKCFTCKSALKLLVPV